MKEYFCKICNYLWHSVYIEECPECTSQDIESNTPEWIDGFFEGDMPTMAQDNSIIED